jgi:hypothetical protein
MAENPSKEQDAPTEQGQSINKSHGYERQKWAGLTHYQCDFCPFDTFGRDVIDDHMLRQHGPEVTV